jgi:hypothetical protein
MNTSEKFLTVGLALFSALTSFMFVYYGVGVISGVRISQPQAIFAYVTAGYGLLNIYILSFAWRARAGWAVPANKLIALCYFGVFVFDRINAGLQNGLVFVGIAAIALVLALNWLAVKKLAERSQSRR